MIRCLACAFNAIFKSRARLVAENLCLRQQLIVLKRRQVRPQLRDADRRFWVLACQWFSGWRGSLIVVKPDTVVGWHRKGWKAYWRWRSHRPAGTGRRRIEPELRELIRRMARENPVHPVYSTLLTVLPFSGLSHFCHSANVIQRDVT